MTMRADTAALCPYARGQRICPHSDGEDCTASGNELIHCPLNGPEDRLVLQVAVMKRLLPEAIKRCVHHGDTESTEK